MRFSCTYTFYFFELPKWKCERWPTEGFLRWGHFVLFRLRRGSKAIASPEAGGPGDAGPWMGVNTAQRLLHTLGCAKQAGRRGCLALWLWPVSYGQLSLPLKLHPERPTAGPRWEEQRWGLKLSLMLHRFGWAPLSHNPRSEAEGEVCRTITLAGLLQSLGSLNF